MSKQDNGGPAFPVLERLDSPSHEYKAFSEGGMTLRDYFAAKAMDAFISGAMADGTPFSERDSKTVAEIAYQVASAMILERAK